MYTNTLVKNSLSWNTTKKKTEESWTHGRIIFFYIILFRMAVFWKLKYLGYYGRDGLGLRLGLRLGLGLGLRLGLGLGLGLVLGLGILNL